MPLHPVVPDQPVIFPYTMKDLELAAAKGTPVNVTLIGHRDPGLHTTILSSLRPSSDPVYDKVASGAFADLLLAFFLGYPNGYEVHLVEDQSHSQVTGTMRE